MAALANKIGLRYEPIAFRSCANARAYAARCKKPMRVVMGDVPDYWVVCPADAAKLERAGYEIARTVGPAREVRA